MEARDTSAASAKLQANHKGFGSCLRPWAFFFFFFEQGKEGKWQKLWCSVEKIGLDDGAQPMVALVLDCWGVLLAQCRLTWMVSACFLCQKISFCVPSKVTLIEESPYMPPPLYSCKMVRLEIQPYQSPLIALLPFHAMSQLGQKPGCKNLYVGENQHAGKTPICIRGGSTR